MFLQCLEVQFTKCIVYLVTAYVPKHSMVTATFACQFDIDSCQVPVSGTVATCRSRTVLNSLAEARLACRVTAHAGPLWRGVCGVGGGRVSGFG